MDDDDFDFVGPDTQSFIPSSMAAPSTQPATLTGLGGGGGDFGFSSSFPPTSSSAAAGGDSANLATNSSSSSGNGGGLDLDALYRRLADGGGNNAGHGDDHDAGADVHEGSRNFQALLSLPSDRLPRTVLPSGVGPGSLKAALRTYVDSSRGRKNKAAVAALAATLAEGGGSASPTEARDGHVAAPIASPTASADADFMSNNNTATTDGDNNHAASPTAQQAPSSLAPPPPPPMAININTGGYSWRSQRKERIRWSEDETRRFFDALQQYGADFTLISILFPGRRREDIQKKYKTEMKTRPRLVEEALHSSQQLPVDLEQLDEGLKQWAEHSKPAVVPLTDEDARLMMAFTSGGGGGGGGGEGSAAAATTGGGDDFDFGGDGGDGNGVTASGDGSFADPAGFGFGGADGGFTSAFAPSGEGGEWELVDDTPQYAAAPSLVGEDGGFDDPSSAMSVVDMISAKASAKPRAKRVAPATAAKRAREEAAAAAAANAPRGRGHGDADGDFAFL